MKKVFIYLGIGGSGGYIEYLRGIFSNKDLWEDSNHYVVIGGSYLVKEIFGESLKYTSNFTVRLSHNLDSNNPLLRIISKIKDHIWVNLIYRPSVIFLPSGFYIMPRYYGNCNSIIACCHNILLFRDDLIEEDSSNRAFFTQYASRQKMIFSSCSDIIYFSDYSNLLVSPNFKSSQPHVIPHAANKRFYEVHTKDHPEFVGRINLVYTSSFYHYKNQDRVVDAMYLLVSAGIDVHLTLIGSGDRGYIDLITKKIKDLSLVDKILIIEKVSHDDLIKIYNNSDIFIFASSIESFGISLLEAMMAGLNIICSRESGLPALAQDGALYVDPTNAHEIFQAVLSIITNVPDANTRKRRARTISHSFSWMRSAVETKAIIDSY